MKKTLLPILAGILLTPLMVFALSIIMPVQGGSGTGIKPTIGQILIGQSDGTYLPQSTSSLGISCTDCISYGYASSTYGLGITYPFASNVAAYASGQLSEVGWGEAFQIVATSTLTNTEFWLFRGDTIGTIYSKIYNTTGTYGSTTNPMLATSTAIATSNDVNPNNLGGSTPVAASTIFTFSGSNKIVLSPGYYVATAETISGTEFGIDASSLSSNGIGSYNNGSYASPSWMDAGANYRFNVYAQPYQQISAINANGLLGLGNFIYLATSSASTNGALASTDWTKFNNKGTVSSASVITANGVSATVATATTTPAFTFTLGDITPSTVNALTIGYGGGSVTSNTALGVNALASGSSTLDTFNVAVGNSALQNNTTGVSNTAVGFKALQANTTGGGSVALGLQSLVHLNASSTGGSVGLGTYAGYYATSTSNELFINNRDRSSYIGDITKSLIYGQFNSATSSQSVTINGALKAWYQSADGTPGVSTSGSSCTITSIKNGIIVGATCI